MTRNHAKFFLLRNDNWHICVRSSMNLNRNPRLEQFDLDDSKELCDFFQGIISEIFEKMPAGLTRSTKICDPVFNEIINPEKKIAQNKDIWTPDFKWPEEDFNLVPHETFKFE